MDVYLLNTDNIEINVAGLPFGEKEKKRLITINSHSRQSESFGCLAALSHLCKICKVKLPADIERDENGKPFFADKLLPSFSLSHSNGFAAAALSSDKHCVGIDIEVVESHKRIERLCNRFFSSEEHRKALQSNDPTEAFYRIWTAKEAKSKADGRGLSYLLSNNENNSFYTFTETVMFEDMKICVSVSCEDPINSIKIHTKKEAAYELQN